MLKRKFRPEFLNRLDEIVYYKSLTKDETRKIVDLQLEDLRHRMDEGKHLKLDVTTAAKDFIIDSSYDSVYGARPIKRFIQSRVGTLIAKAIIQGSATEGATLTVDSRRHEPRAPLKPETFTYFISPPDKNACTGGGNMIL